MLRPSERQDIIEDMIIEAEAVAMDDLEDAMEVLREKQMFSEEQLKTIEDAIETACKGAAHSAFWTGLDTGKELEGGEREE